MNPSLGLRRALPGAEGLLIDICLSAGVALLGTFI
jgi:hypothetical protein